MWKPPPVVIFPAVTAVMLGIHSRNQLANLILKFVSNLNLVYFIFARLFLLFFIFVLQFDGLICAVFSSSFQITVMELFILMGQRNVDNYVNYNIFKHHRLLSAQYILFFHSCTDYRRTSFFSSFIKQAIRSSHFAFTFN